MADPGEVIVTTDEIVRTTDEAVQTTDEVVAPDILTSERAARALVEMFGPLVDADYLTGKTALCDALAARFDLSILMAEELCDELERAERIRFVRTPDGAGWHIHALPDAP